MLSGAGSPLGALGLVFWALTASRPGPYKARIEWLLGALCFSAQTTWMALVFWAAMPFVFVAYGVWAMYPGALLWRLAQRLPLSLATALCWTGFEALLTWTKTPLGLSWLRLGHYAGDWPTLAGSARVWGDLGLGFVLAAVAGFLADLWRARAVGQRVSGASLAGVGVPLCSALILALVVRPPETEIGPRLLLVQPAFEQKRKQLTGDPDQLLRESFALTAEALEQNRAAGGREPDLVAWGESMLFCSWMEAGLEDEVGKLDLDPWHVWKDLDAAQKRRTVLELRQREAMIVGELLGGVPGAPPGAAQVLGPETFFVAGLDVLVAHEGRLRGMVGAGLWAPGGARVGLGTKVHLAPGGETMVGLERFEVVRDMIHALANYVPDRLAAEETSSLRLPGADGAAWDFGLSLCFDNAYADPYAGPLRRGPLDFHLVVSNEAWYERSQELDQMLAFSRILALSTGRTLVRVANSGVSAVYGPAGRELARLRVGGRDRCVKGALMVDLPVPREAAAAHATPFVVLQPWLLPLGTLLPLLGLVVCGILGRYRREPEEYGQGEASAPRSPRGTGAQAGPEA
jgi:apolipoprotein N-acyltransferase